MARELNMKNSPKKEKDNLKIHGSFDDVLKASFKGKPKKKVKRNKKTEKNKTKD